MIHADFGSRRLARRLLAVSLMVLALVPSLLGPALAAVPRAAGGGMPPAAPSGGGPVLVRAGARQGTEPSYARGGYYLTLNPGDVLGLSRRLGRGWKLEGSSRLLAEGQRPGELLASTAGYELLHLRMGERRLALHLFVSPLPSVQVSRPDVNWYRTQYGTGIGNCGPALVSMAALWAKGEDLSVRQVRAEIGYPYADGSLAMDHLRAALSRHGVRFRDRVVESDADLRAIVDRGHIAMVVIDSDEIEPVRGDPREDLFGRYYQPAGGHYVIVKGHSLDGRYFVVYDPMPSDWDSNRLRYADGSMIGMNRYYSSSHLVAALGDRTVIEVSPDP